MKYFKGKYSEGSGGRIRETFFHSRRKIFMLRKKVMDDLSPTDSIPLGSFSNICCSFKHWMSLCHYVKSPYCSQGCFWLWEWLRHLYVVPRQAICNDHMGWGRLGQAVSWELLVSYIFKNLPWGLQLEARMIQMCSKQLETMLSILRECSTSAHQGKGKENISSGTLSHSGVVYQC